MAEHRIRKNGIIYIVPTDELFQKLRKNEAFIDDYGRLVDIRTKRIIKELKQIADNQPVVVVQPKEEHPIMNAIVDGAVDGIRDAVYKWIYGLVYDEIPYIWQEKVVPVLETLREYKENGGKLKCERILEKQQVNASKTVMAKPRPSMKMTKEEADAEKRKVLYHWIGLLDGLTKLQNAGELDIASALEQLTTPAMLERVNGFLSENPNLLETDRYILLHRLLGRDLYKEIQFLPIETVEIEKVAISHGLKIPARIDNGGYLHGENQNHGDQVTV